MKELTDLLSTPSSVDIYGAFRWVEEYRVTSVDYVAETKKYELAIKARPDVQQLDHKFLLRSFLEKLKLDKNTYAMLATGMAKYWEDMKEALDYIKLALAPLSQGAMGTS
eukprot:2328506-Lingulodinium_polyedra.AAC.1